MEIPPILRRVFGYLRLKSLKWTAVLDLETCIYIPVRCYHYYWREEFGIREGLISEFHEGSNLLVSDWSWSDRVHHYSLLHPGWLYSFRLFLEVKRITYNTSQVHSQCLLASYDPSPHLGEGFIRYHSEPGLGYFLEVLLESGGRCGYVRPVARLLGTCWSGK